MPDIPTDIVAQVIMLAREAEDTGDSTARAELAAFIDAQNEEDQFMLVALAWIGRESFGPDEYEEALAAAEEEATTPTVDYLTNMPLLADFLTDGMEAMGYSAGDAEDELM